MNDHLALEPESLPSQPAGAVEERVRRLENAVAALQDTQLVGERILERLRDDRGTQPAGQPPPPAPAYSELGAMIRMFFDIHYHVAWTTRILVLVFIPLILTSHWWFPPAWVYGIGFLFDKLLDVLLAFFLYKVLAAEARRYAQTTLHTPASQDGFH